MWASVGRLWKERPVALLGIFWLGVGLFWGAVFKRIRWGPEGRKVSDEEAGVALA